MRPDGSGVASQSPAAAGTSGSLAQALVAGSSTAARFFSVRFTMPPNTYTLPLKVAAHALDTGPHTYFGYLLIGPKVSVLVSNGSTVSWCWLLGLRPPM